MKTLIIYDSEGYVLQQIKGSYRVPQGVPYLETQIPKGKRIKNTDGIGVDVSETPHQVILEDIPPTEIDVLRNDLNEAVMELSMLIAMGGNA